MSKTIIDRAEVKPQQPSNFYWIWGVLLAVVLLTAAIRIRLLDIPLERDEGEYAYGGQLILQGLPSDAPLYNIKPGMYIAYALIQSVFGQTHTGIHLGLLVINVATIFLLFFLTKRLFDPVTAVTAAFCNTLIRTMRSRFLSKQGTFRHSSCSRRHPVSAACNRLPAMVVVADGGSAAWNFIYHET